MTKEQALICMQEGLKVFHIEHLRMGENIQDYMYYMPTANIDEILDVIRPQFCGVHCSETWLDMMCDNGWMAF